MRIRSMLCTLAVTAGTTLAATAQVTNFDVVSSSTGTPAGYVANQLFVSFDGQLTDAQILTSGLSAGDVYQDAVGSNTAPASAFIPVFPSLGNDTFVQFGATTPCLQGRMCFVKCVLREAGFSVIPRNNPLGSVHLYEVDIGAQPSRK